MTVLTDVLRKLAAGVRLALAPSILLLPTSCITAPDCRWRLIAEPRVIIAEQRGIVRPAPSVLVRPVCVARSRPA